MERMVALLGHARRNLLLPAALGTKPLVLKVDTGACCSVVPLEIVKKGGLAHLVDKGEAKDLGGMKACGILDAPLVCRDVALWGRIYVSEDCTVPLLGLDVLYNHSCSIVPSRSLPHLVVREAARDPTGHEASPTAGHVPWSVPHTLHPVTLNGYPVEALLDTGASHSLVPLATVRALGLNMARRERPVTLNFVDGCVESTHYVPSACLRLGILETCVGVRGACVEARIEEGENTRARNSGWEVRGRELDVYSSSSDLVVGMNVLRKFRMEFHDDYTMVVSPLH